MWDIIIFDIADHLTVDDIAEEEGITPNEVEIGYMPTSTWGGA